MMRNKRSEDMLGNSSSSNDTSVPFSLPFNMHCFLSRPSSFILTLYIVTTIFILLPLCIIILSHGFQQWRKGCSTSSASTMSHSDCFTYHMVTMELIGAVGWIVCCCSIYKEDIDMLFVGFILSTFTFHGQMFLHVLTCLERYLAVVHPITYMKLRNERGIRIRNISIGCVWLLCFTVMGVVVIENVLILDACLQILSTMFVSFCTVSVLYVLNRTGPGEHKEMVDQSKQRAFYTIMAILGALVLRFAGSVIWSVLFQSELNNECLIMAFTSWLNLPSNLVLPLLFLHRAGKLVCCKNNDE